MSSELQSVSCLGGGIQFWKDFIKIYENSPALWDTRSMAYKKPYLKREAYINLRNKLREIDPNVEVDYVKRRINGLRSCYRRELRRIQESKRKGDDFYRPTLFYFKQMQFLDDVLDIDLERDAREGRVERRGRKPKANKQVSKKIIQSDSSTSSDSSEDSSNQSSASSTASLATSPNQQSSKSPTAQHSTANGNGNATSSLPQSSSACASGATATFFSNSPTLAYSGSVAASASAAASATWLSMEAQTLGASWVALYHRLEREQQLYANKAIMEVLYQGALGRLTADSYKSLERDMSNNFLDDHRIMDAINEELATDFISKANSIDLY